jgi:hypothetical protein
MQLGTDLESNHVSSQLIKSIVILIHFGLKTTNTNGKIWIKSRATDRVPRGLYPPMTAIISQLTISWLTLS